MLNILFPKVCVGCKCELLKFEQTLCTRCLHGLPIACHHRTSDASMKHIFYGRVAIEHATALFHFQKKGLTQDILHNLKYKGQHKISSYFGKWLGSELAELPEYRSIDVVIPVPLHKQRLRKRGYNQVAGFGKEVANALGVPYIDNVLLKITKTRSQVLKKRFTRFQSDQVFTVTKNELIAGKHILLVDDIVTTGATLENCALQLQKDTKIVLSFATIAIA